VSSTSMVCYVLVKFELCALLQMTDDIAKISKDYIFVIPPYFALILRAFSVLEGIGLEVDPDYSIVNACYPYLSKRLLTDDR
jgi:aarF domain-containing kinase